MQELLRFITDGEEIKQKLKRLKRTCSSEKELDAEINKLLLKGKINSQITKRISDAMPGCLRDYLMLCLYSHPSMEGFRLCFDEEGAFDLIFQNITYLAFRVLVCFYRILILLKLLTAKTDECFSGVIYMMLDCHRRIANIRSSYSKQAYRKTKIESTFEAAIT